MNRVFTVLVLSLLVLPALAQLAGKIGEVTVYRGQALVTRDVEFAAVAGAQEIVVSPLPERVIPESLYAVGDADVTVRAVRYRVTAVGEEPRDEVRAIDDQLKEKGREQKRIASELGVLESKSRYLDKLENFVAVTATAETSKGSLNPQALTDTSLFIFQQRTETAGQKLDLENEKAEIENDINTLNRQRSELMRGSSKTQREAVLLIDSARARQVKCKLSYLVSGVNWSPAYSARLNDKKDRLALEYHAVVNQMSGEDWSNVKLTLSTTRPNMIAVTPILTPLWISLTAGGQPAKFAEEGYREQRSNINRQLKLNDNNAGVVMPGAAGPQGVTNAPSVGIPSFDNASAGIGWEQNVLAGQLQNLELSARDEDIRQSRNAQAEETEGLAVAYDLPGAVSLQSRTDQQMFRIATLDLKADSFYNAVPLLSDFVYLTADAVNTSEYPLLPGTYNAYVNGSFAGRGWLPLVARGQGLTIGLGSETQILAVRELVDKKTDIRGGNQIVTYNYRVRLQNFMAQPAKVRLWDRAPQAPDSAVTISLTGLEPALSTDAQYLAEKRPRGLLRWDLEVPAGASGVKALEVKYQLQMEFDKNYAIGEIPAQMMEKMRKDFDSQAQVMFNINPQ